MIQLYAAELSKRLSAALVGVHNTDTPPKSIVEFDGKNLLVWTQGENGTGCELQTIPLGSVKTANRLQNTPPSNVSEEGVTELVIQPIEANESCTNDVVLDDGTIERYEIRRIS